MDTQEKELNLFTQTFLIKVSDVTYNGVKNYKIYKNSNSKQVLTIETPRIIRANFTNNDYRRIQTLKLGNEILYFKKVMALNFDPKCLNILYTNLKNIEIKEKQILLMCFIFSLGGYYIHKKNKIKILKRSKKDVLPHELFHMASSIYDKKHNKGFSGFLQIDWKTGHDIGNGLNEGYTELLTSRYFNIDDVTSDEYKTSKTFAFLLEKIVGQEFMEKSYLKANLPSLITELEKYDTIENIIRFIYAWDYYFKYSEYKKLLLSTENKTKLKDNINECIKIIKHSLIKWYNTKEKNTEKQEFYLKYIIQKEKEYCLK